MDDTRHGSDEAELAGVVTSITSRMLRLASERPGFRAMLSGPASQDPLAQAGERLRSRFASEVATALPAVSAGESFAAAEVITQIVRGLIARIVSSSGAIDQQLSPHLDLAVIAYITEVKRLAR